MNWQYDNELDSHTNKTLDYFFQLSRYPRVSGNEAGIRQHLLTWADQHGYSHATDKVGNLVIYVPATSSCTTANRQAAGNKSSGEPNQTVILQGHMDMVGEKLPNSQHDFSSDPIIILRNGDILHADQTTLGADNGIAIAIAQMIASSDDICHPALELCFTVQEETGLIGAAELDTNLLNGRKLINLDSEDEGVITIGCAGGQDSHIVLPINRIPSDSQVEKLIPVVLGVSGLRGGHSGVEIHEKLANGLQLLGRFLHQAKQQMKSVNEPCMIVAINGGNAHNAIPRDASALLYCTPQVLTILQGLAADMQKDFAGEYYVLDQKVNLFASKLQVCPTHIIQQYNEAIDWQPMDSATTQKAINAMLALPHGVRSYSEAVPGLVETSSNFAAVHTKRGTIEFLCSQRSSLPSALKGISTAIDSVAGLMGASITHNNGYPPWPPKPDSGLLRLASDTYTALFGKPPHIESIHAGLECGLIGAKFPGMDMISIGPTIKYPHSPEEQMSIESLQKLIMFLLSILDSLCQA